MWKQVLEIGKQLVALMRDVQQTKDALKELQQERKEDRQEIKELNEKVDRLTEIVQRMAFELQRQRDKSDTDHKMLLLEVENTILRSGRGLPVGEKSPPEPPDLQ